MAIAIHKTLMLGYRQARQQGGQRLRQTEADDAAARFVGGHCQIEIAASILNRGDDHAGGIHEGAIPIEYQKVIALRHADPVRQ